MPLRPFGLSTSIDRKDTLTEGYIVLDVWTMIDAHHYTLYDLKAFMAWSRFIGIGAFDGDLQSDRRSWLAFQILYTRSPLLQHHTHPNSPKASKLI